MREVWTWMASVLGAIALFQGVVATLFPAALRQSLWGLLHRILSSSSSYSYFDISESDGVSTNELYSSVQLYLSSSPVSATSPPPRLSLSRHPNSPSLHLSLSSTDTVSDTFLGAPLRWDHIVSPRPAAGPHLISWRPLPEEKRGFTLRVRRADRDRVLLPYLDHVVERAREIRRRSEDRFLYTNSRAGAGLDSARPGHPWDAVPLNHPSTFATLAMDPRRKRHLMDDLSDFAHGEAFYRATGRAWKRGYLLYGPPGTGKSSMIAAMANYLNYDIYDLELTEVSSNSELRKLLMKTTPKSIIVIEDIDCSVNLGRFSDGNGKRRRRSSRGGDDAVGYPGPGDGEGGPGSGSVTLSGLLGFTDGLWSCCGSERIFVFTTNHVDKLDPALLRSGRMDMHIHMGPCDFEALKILLRNYVGVEGGDLSEEAWRELEAAVGEAGMTPADVSEVLIRHRRREKARVAAELAGEMRRRGERKWGAANEGEEGEEEEEEEEQEKRELFEMNCDGGGGCNDVENDSMVVDCSKEGVDDEDKKFK